MNMKKFYSLAAFLLLILAALSYPGCDLGSKNDSSDFLGLGASNSTDGPSGPAATAWPPAGFTEHPADQNTRFPSTVATDVKVAAPLPTSFPSHPTECDCIHFLRIKHASGPANPSDADRVLIAQPGVLEGASAFYNVAANLVTRAYNEKGKFVEFWTVDRRPNCLEDLNGLKLAKTTGNIHDAIDYYYRGKPYNGKTFKGYLSPYKDAAWLAEMGMDRTVRDWNEIITRGIPDQSVRKKKVYLGGHSLGGFITGAYACWDFDGDPSTTADAGYNQCAGFFGLDTLVTAVPMLELMSGGNSGMDLSELVGSIPDMVVDMLRSGDFPRFVALSGVIDPEVMHLLAGLGIAAYLDPKGESDSIEYLPASQAALLSFRFYHSRDLCAFLSPTPTLEMYRYTNEALLAVFTDDNTMPLSIVRASMGFFTGGPVTDKDFPIPSAFAEALQEIPGLESITALIGGEKLAIASDSGSPCKKKDGPLYGWLNYNQIQDDLIPLDSSGEPYTSSAREVTDVTDFARCISAWPMDFTEKYFPFRLAIDSMLGTDGIVHADGVSKRPVIDIIAGDGPNLGGDQNPVGSPIIPGYDHIDVLTAAPVQNDGQPEKVTTNLLNFIFQ
jgi:hypothetical protein